MVPQNRMPAPSRRDLWRIVNRPRPFDPHTIRLACTILLAVYAGVTVARYEPGHPGFLWIRPAVCLYALLGARLAARFTWPALRAYTVGLALILPLGTAYIDGMLGNDVSELPLTALATFVPLVFLQTGWDFVLVGVALIAGNGLLISILPAPAVPVRTVLIVLGGAIATGTTAGATLLVYRGRLQESLTWWQKALQAKSEFLNTMSHELRSPIHVILGYTDMVREEAALSADASEALDRVRASAIELLHLVENTMNAARLDTGKVPLRVEEFAPAELARDLADSIRALPEASRGVGVRWDVAPDLPRVRLDRLKVKEIVQNLVSNALKFTPRGEVRVTLGCDGDRLQIAVRDTGVGIPPEAQARIFGMFERVESTDGAAPPGVGLGLYIVNRLVELMRGRAALESVPGTGSCFTVLLPLRLE